MRTFLLLPAPARRWMATAVLVPALVAAAAVGAPVAVAAGGVVVITSLSQRADLVSGGDALVQIDLPTGTDLDGLRVDVGGRDVSDLFAKRPTGQIQGVVTGMALGRNVVRAVLPDGRGARLTVTNSPIGGPVFSGPQIQPWTCADGALDAQCNRPPRYEYLYKSSSGGGLRSYDPSNPPSDVATTRSDTGETVPFIVRQEIGVLARDEYRIAALYDPELPSAPWDPPAGVNSKLLITHGASCDTAYAQGAAPAVTNEPALGKGFIVMSHALDNAGHNCNIITQAESLVMTKEKVVEQFGPIRYTIGSGCSGGSLVQLQVANAYPGLYQGLTPQCSFTDAWSSAQQYVDYEMLRGYFEQPNRWAPGVAWTPVQMESAYGHPNVANPITFTEVIPPGGDPSRSCPGVPAADVYNEKTNPGGVRCSLHDYMVNVFGETPDGKARRPFDNVGIQYGLSGLLEGTMTIDQFVDLNTKIGAFDLDYNYQPSRTAADPFALDRVYKSGAVNTGNNLDQVAIIDLRGPDPGAFHDVYRTYSMRDRLIREHGTAANMVLWRGQVPLLGDTNYVAQSIVAVDAWLAAVEKDTRDVPLARKIIEDKPSTLVDRCTDGAGLDLPAAVCDATVVAYASPRIEAGVPVTDDTMKCQLQPLRAESYPVPIPDALLSRLHEAFPAGVCDYSKPGVSQAGAVEWMTYADTVGGRPLGAAPVSVPFGPSGGTSARPAPLPATGLPTVVSLAAVVMAGLGLRSWRARARLS